VCVCVCVWGGGHVQPRRQTDLLAVGAMFFISWSRSTPAAAAAFLRRFWGSGCNAVAVRDSGAMYLSHDITPAITQPSERFTWGPIPRQAYAPAYNCLTSTSDQNK